ncbi:MAG: DNA translocase FtsK 4TM domain-containing protein, partial [Rhodospirillaceae bacterium]
MARRTPTSRRFLPESLSGFLRRSGIRLFGMAVIAAAAATAVALATHAPGDPSWNTVSNAPVRNLLGRPGATLSDLLLQTLGIAAWAPVLIAAAWGAGWMILRRPPRVWLRPVALAAAMPPLVLAFTFLPWVEHAPAAAGWGGAAGALMRLHLDPLLRPPVPPWAAPVVSWGLGIPLALLL